MKRIIAFVLLMVVSLSASARKTEHASLSKAQKDSLRKEIEIMVLNDQKYRWMIMFGELDEQKINEFKKMNAGAQAARIRDVRNNKVGIPLYQKDSLAVFQNEIDSINFTRLWGIINEYGYPVKYIASYEVSTILLHSSALIMKHNFLKVLKQEVTDGDMAATEYAMIYDRIQMEQKLPQLYYAYDNAQKPLNLEETNKARAEIGLKRIKE